ncbi:MAG TPA: beta-ketoacyl synthase chain length factor [Gammaproteobacteria bacterium]|nr:beta-ketoacyl synthase chain length factor [Gammaproteobacteria bacterium]
MNVWVEGIGIWGPGMTSWADCRACLTGATEADGQYGEPPATALSAQERRRSTASVRIAAEIAAQACAAAGRDAAEYATVSASSTGDLATADAICRTLAIDARLLSPTRFHNSVHNAPAGYWSIVSGCQQAANALAAGAASFAAGLLEAVVQCTVEARPVMLLAYDLPGPSPLAEVCGIAAGFGVALAFTPAPATGAPMLQIRYDGAGAEETVLDNPQLEALRLATPGARCLPLLAVVAKGTDGSVKLAMEAGSLAVAVAGADDDARKHNAASRHHCSSDSRS